MTRPAFDTEKPATGRPARNIGMDVLRIVSICGVVAIHVFGLRVAVAPKAGRSWWTATAIDIGFIWVVPVFVMISGALLLGSRQLTEAPGSFYRRRAARLLPALIAWHLVYLVGIRIWLRHEHLTTARILQLIYDGSVFTQLYFLWLILGLYAVAPLLAAFLRAGGEARARATAAAVLAATVAAFMLPSILTSFHVARPITLNVFTYWMPYVGYFLAGYALRNVRLKGWRLPAVAVPTVLLGVFTVWHYGRPGHLPVIDVVVRESYLGPFVALMALGVFVVVLSVFADVRLPRRGAAVVVALSNASFGVFLVHLVILEPIRLNVPAVGVNHSLPAIALAYLVTVVASFAISVAAARIPLLRRIF